MNCLLCSKPVGETEKNFPVELVVVNKILDWQNTVGTATFIEKRYTLVERKNVVVCRRCTTRERNIHLIAGLAIIFVAVMLCAPCFLTEEKLVSPGTFGEFITGLILPGILIGFGGFVTLIGGLMGRDHIAGELASDRVKRGLKDSKYEVFFSSRWEQMKTQKPMW